MIVYESEGKFLGEPYIVNGLRQRKGDKVKHAALERIGSNDSLESIEYDEFDRKITTESSVYSKAYRVFAVFFTSCKDAVFGRPRPSIRDWDYAFEVDEKDKYVPGKFQPVRAQYNYDCEFDMRAAEPTCYERISRYVYSVYEWMVWRFYDFFGIDD